MLDRAISFGHPVHGAGIRGHGAAEAAGRGGIGILVGRDLFVIGGGQLIFRHLGDFVAHSLLDQIIVGGSQLHVVQRIPAVAVDGKVILRLFGADLVVFTRGVGIEGIVGLLVMLVGLGLNLRQLVGVQREAATLHLLGDGDVLDLVFHDGLLHIGHDIAGHADAIHAVHLAHIGVLRRKAGHHVLLRHLASIIGGDDAGILLFQSGKVLIQLHDRVNANQIAAGKHQHQYDQKAGQPHKRVSHHESSSPLRAQSPKNMFTHILYTFRDFPQGILAILRCAKRKISRFSTQIHD